MNRTYSTHAQAILAAEALHAQGVNVRILKVAKACGLTRRVAWKVAKA